MSVIRTSNGWFPAEGNRCCNQALAIGARPKLAPFVVEPAARNASTNKPITSSITAAPRIMVDSGEDILPASMRVRAEIETLVAVRAPPKKKAVCQERPKICATAAPRKKD